MDAVSFFEKLCFWRGYARFDPEELKMEEKIENIVKNVDNTFKPQADFMWDTKHLIETGLERVGGSIAIHCMETLFSMRPGFLVAI